MQKRTMLCIPPAHLMIDHARVDIVTALTNMQIFHNGWQLCRGGEIGRELISSHDQMSLFIVHGWHANGLIRAAVVEQAIIDVNV